MSRGQEDQNFWPKYFVNISQDWSALNFFLKPILMCHCVPKYLEFLTVLSTYLFCFITTLYCIPVTRHEVEVSSFNMLLKYRQFLGEHSSLVAKVLKKGLLLPATPQNQYPLDRGWICPRVGLVELEEWQKSIYITRYTSRYTSLATFGSRRLQDQNRDAEKLPGGPSRPT